MTAEPLSFWYTKPCGQGNLRAGSGFVPELWVLNEMWYNICLNYYMLPVNDHNGNFFFLCVWLGKTKEWILILSTASSLLQSPYSVISMGTWTKSCKPLHIYYLSPAGRLNLDRNTGSSLTKEDGSVHNVHICVLQIKGGSSLSCDNKTPLNVLTSHEDTQT